MKLVILILIIIVIWNLYIGLETSTLRVAVNNVSQFCSRIMHLISLEFCPLITLNWFYSYLTFHLDFDPNDCYRECFFKTGSFCKEIFQHRGSRLRNDIPDSVKLCIDIFNKNLRKSWRDFILANCRWTFQALETSRNCKGHLEMLHQNCAVLMDQFVICKKGVTDPGVMCASFTSHQVNLLKF